MDKHEAMVLQNKARSNAKVNHAVSVIKQMLHDDQHVVVCELVKRTGFSRAFFYNNEIVRAELNRAQQLQEGKSFVAPQKMVINKAMEKEIELLKKKLLVKDKIIADKEKENVRLQKAVNACALKTIKEL